MGLKIEQSGNEGTYAGHLCGRVGQTVPRLVGLLADGHADVRAHAAGSLMRLGLGMGSPCE